MSTVAKRSSILPPLPPSGPKPPTHFSSTLTIADALLIGTHSITIQSETIIHPRARLESLLGPILIGRRCILHERACLGIKPGGGSPAGISVKPAAAAVIITSATTPAPEQEACEQQQQPSAESLPSKGGGVSLGDYVTIEVGAVVEAGGTQIDEGTKVGIGSRVGAGARIGKYCTIGPMCAIPPGEVLEDYTVLCANGMRRRQNRVAADLRPKAQVRELDVSRKLISNKAEKYM